MTNQKGATTLIITVILLVTATLIVIYAAQYSILQQKISANQYKAAQAFEAAEAGLEFGMMYLDQNAGTIQGSAANGFINYGSSDSHVTSVTLANGSSYSVIYTNPTQNNYSLILIRATGTSADGSSTRTIQQQVYATSLIKTAPVQPITSIGQISLDSNSLATNLQTPITISSGNSVSLNGGSQTTTQTGGSIKGNLGPDIQQNYSSLTSATSDTLFNNYFGMTGSYMRNMVTRFFASGTDASVLNGLSGMSIWYDGNLSIQNTTTIGTNTAPVILIINGQLSSSSSLTLYGFLYTTGQINIQQPANIFGAIASADQSQLKNFTITYDNTILKNAGANSNFAKVPGSWKDF